MFNYNGLVIGIYGHLYVRIRDLHIVKLFSTHHRIVIVFGCTIGAKTSFRVQILQRPRVAADYITRMCAYTYVLTLIINSMLHFLFLKLI